MEGIINTLLVSCIPAVITGVVTYLTASRNAKVQIASLQGSSKHEIEKLMRQHEVDIESLKEKHHLEADITVIKFLRFCENPIGGCEGV